MTGQNLNVDRVVALETFRLRGHPNLLIVQVRTAAGFVGTGDTFYAPGAVDSFVHEVMAQRLLGSDPSAIAKHWDDTATRQFARWGGFGAELRALSAIDVALWDIRGQALGVPIYQLLGGLAHESLPTYNTCAGPGYGRGPSDGEGPQGQWDDLWAQRNAPGDLARSLLAEGISAMKIWPFDDIAKANGGRSISETEMRTAIEPIEAIRDAVGLEIDIMIEGHGLWDLATAKKIAAATEPYRLAWLEDLVIGSDIEAVGELTASTTTPVIASEMIGTRGQYRQLLENRAADLVMVDPTWVGGITETRKIVDLAESFDRSVAMHDCTGPFTLLAGLHVGLASRNVIYQESVRAYLRTWYADLTDGSIKVIDGRILPPVRSGIGLGLSETVANDPNTISRKSAI